MNGPPQHEGLRRVDGVIVGFRAWVAITPDLPPWVRKTTYLESTNFRYAWRPGINLAEHLNYPTFWDPRPPPADHIAPLRGCLCGFYIMRDLPGLIRTIQGLGLNDDVVLGVVTGWGKTVQHKLGWRCQCASIVGLLDAPQLARSYQVDTVTQQAELEELGEWAKGRISYPHLQRRSVIAGLENSSGLPTSL